MGYQEFVDFFNLSLEKIKVDPVRYFIQSQNILGITLTPAQRVIIKIALGIKLDSKIKYDLYVEVVADKFTLEEKQYTEEEIYYFLTDKRYDYKHISQFKINKIDLVCGRRSGKSLIAAILSIYLGVTTNWRPFLRLTPAATVLIMSHSKEFSDEVLDLMREMLQNSPLLSKLINKDKKNTASTLFLKVPFLVNGAIMDSQVQLKVGAASSKTTRGGACCVIICDEIAFWNLDENMKETDVKILKAVRPTMKQFGEKGMLIKLSSPAIKQGVLFNEYEMDKRGELPETYAVFKAPSWFMNNVIPIKEYYEEERLDSEAFDNEYRANFKDSLSNFILPETVERAVLKNVKFLAPSSDKNVKYYASIDAAFKADRFTFSLVGITENRVTQYISKGWEGSRRVPITSSIVAQWIKTAIKDFPVDFIAADQFAFQPLKEIFEIYGVTLKENTFTPKFKKQIYFNLKKLFHSEQIDLLDNPLQTKEIKELVVEQSASGTIKIGHPMAGSDDFSDALAVAAYLAVENVSAGKFEFDTALSMNTYDIKMDSEGRAVGAAPSVDMLTSQGYLDAKIIDNSASYAVDPLDGILKHISKILDDDDEDSGPQFIF